MSDKVDETVSRARKMGEKAKEFANDEYDSMSKKMREKQEMMDSFVHEEPYKAIGIGVLAGIGIGFVLCSLMCRRRD
jgi:ElaB/YqjD/DUF883 family membrane-anchored ribosome-binding protein